MIMIKYIKWDLDANGTWMLTGPGCWMEPGQNRSQIKSTPPQYYYQYYQNYNSILVVLYSMYIYCCYTNNIESSPHSSWVYDAQHNSIFLCLMCSNCKSLVLLWSRNKLLMCMQPAMYATIQHWISILHLDVHIVYIMQIYQCTDIIN